MPLWASIYLPFVKNSEASPNMHESSSYDEEVEDLMGTPENVKSSW